MTPRPLLLVVLLLPSGCGSSKPGPPSAVGDAAGSQTAESSPPPGIGACGCLDDATCIAHLDKVVSALRAPRQIDRHYVGSQCVARDPQDSRRCSYARPAVCVCYYAFGASNERRYENAYVLGNRDTERCDVDGRSQACLYRSCEFPGCDPGNATSCDAVCADLVARVAADESRSFDAERRTARCEQPSCTCRGVYRVGNLCYAGTGPFARAYDCALGDEAILAAEYPPPPPPPPAGPPTTVDGGAVLAPPVTQDAGAVLSCTRDLEAVPPASCSELTSIALATIEAAVSSVPQCAVDDDCQPIALSADCWPSCQTGGIRGGAATRSAIANRAAELAIICGAFRQAGCKVVEPGCPPPPAEAIACRSGRCVHGP